MFTLDELETEVRRLAAEKPDFVYEKPVNSHICKYVVEDEGRLKGSCIMGQALINLGVSARELSHWEGTGIGAIVANQGISGERNWIAQVQYAQDRDASWGDAIKHADDVMKEYNAG